MTSDFYAFEALIDSLLKIGACAIAWTQTVKCNDISWVSNSSETCLYLAGLCRSLTYTANNCMNKESQRSYLGLANMERKSDCLPTNPIQQFFAQLMAWQLT